MSLGAVILAAGAGTRLGGVAKARLRIGDDSFLARIARTARAAGCARVVVVAGPPHGDGVRGDAIGLGLDVAWNPDPARGMASSVAIGVAALAADPALVAALLWPVDHPWIDRDVIARLRAAHAAGATAVVPTVAGRGAHPPLIGRAMWPALIAGHPDGARGVLRAAGARRLEIGDPRAAFDVDTPDDLRRLAEGA